MKKFIKYGMIAGVVMLIGGMGLATASVAMGASGKRVGNLLKERFKGSFIDWADWEDGHQIDISEDGIHIASGGHSVDVSENGVRVSSENSGLSISGEDAAPEPDLASPEPELVTPESELVTPESELVVPESGASGEQWVSPGVDGGFEAGYPAVTELEISQSGGSVAIYGLENISELTVKSKRGSLNQVSYKESGGKSRLTVKVRANEEYQIFIPDSWELDKLEAKVKGGALNGSGIRAYKTDLHTSNGAVSVSQSSVGELELECENGGISWTASEEMTPEVKAECRNGAVSISFPDTMDSKDFKYDIECRNGKVEVPEFSINGTEERHVAGSKGLPYLKLEVQNGAIGVNQLDY